MPKVLIAEAEQNLRSLQEKRDRASKDLSDEATSFMANPSITPTSARRFDLVLDFLKLQINISTELFHKRLNRKLHDMEMIQRAMGKAEDDEDMRQLLVIITDCRLMDETIRIVERGVQAIHTLNGKDRQIHQEAGPNEPCSSQSVVKGSNVLSRFNSNGGNTVSGDTAMAPPAGFPMRGLYESKVCSTGPRAHVFRLGDPGKSAPGGNAVGRRGTLNLSAGREESSRHRSAPDMGSRERGSTWCAGVLTNRPSTEVTTDVGTVAPGHGGIKRQALRFGGGRSVEVAPSHRGVHGFPVDHEPYGRRIGDMAPIQKPSLNCKASLRNGVEQRVCDDATASTTATTTAEKTKRARTSEGGFRELEKMIRLGGLPRFTVAGRQGPGQHN